MVDEQVIKDYHRLIAEYNAAMNNGLVIKARAIDRILHSMENEYDLP